MGKYILLTNKETFQTDLSNDGLEIVETYNFYFFEKLRAKYSIAKVVDENARIKMSEEYEGKEYVNHIRVKFFERFETIEEVREELYEIVDRDETDPSANSRLVKLESASA
ncbi:hypothetical protein D4T97_011405 [Siminovitchia acidinfaciens]|uniref:Uncharacterized protein n=1 Tax=Siminovitchia acidinfaciens TaxID=2321395 RepID=A0A429XZR9_9BACI|nr:hypothetical protein [Siminovitchia acidinfaciens]RST74273.1 hypothetical protein D4T97_011405 [Siminovitchia acidinfaciens]